MVIAQLKNSIIWILHRNDSSKQGLNTKEFSALFYDFPQGHGDEMSIKEMKEDIINAILNVWGIVKCTMLPFDMKLLPEIITILHPAGANH